MNKKLISLSAAGMLLVSSALPFAAFAENNGQEMKATNTVKNAEKKIEKLDDRIDDLMQDIKDNDSRFGGMKQSVVIGPNGGFRVSGVHVNSVDAAGMKISGSLYGFSKDVSVAGAEFHARGGATIALSDIKEGHTLVVRGTMDPSNHSIVVKYVRDVSLANKPNDNAAKVQARIDELLKMIAALQARLHGGTQ